MLDKTRVPVIVGVGQVTDTTSPPESARSPLQMMLDAARLAAADSGAGEALWGALDSITVIRLFADTVPRFASPFGKLVNPPWSVARRLGAQHATDLVYPRKVAIRRRCCSLALVSASHVANRRRR